ncbi:MAG: biotin-dependent carboxyltransferase family protein [Nocardioidaceae bacterium]
MRSLTVTEAGPLSTVQDRGRPGWAHLGVPRSGALDRPAADLANRLVGNDGSAAVLETTLGGISLTPSEPVTVAVTGAECAVTIGGSAVGYAEPVRVPAGATLRVGPATRGVRSYVGVAGGITVEPVLGSRSTDTLAQVGPPRLRDGDVLPLGDPVGAPAGVDVASARPFPRPALLRLHPGPRADWFDAPSLATLTGTSYAVSRESNRVGLRLEGPAMTRSREGELPSEGLVLGAVQVPPSGQPLVFLHDHPTTGGYPVVAVVDPDDLWLCAQLRPGELVRFSRR